MCVGCDVCCIQTVLVKYFNTYAEKSVRIIVLAWGYSKLIEQSMILSFIICKFFCMDQNIGLMDSNRHLRQISLV